jgi:hypothetical protein
MSDNDQNALFSLLGEVNDLLSRSPKGAAIFEKLRSGELSADEAVRQLAEVARNEGLLPELSEAAREVEALLPTSGALTPDTLAQAKRPVTMKTSTGIPQLNPLYEAAIAERVALDGDAPELRSGPLPNDENARPAVPVLTTSRDPVVIGLMLERASNEVGHQLRLAAAEHRKECERLLTAAGEAAAAKGHDVGTALDLAKKALPPVPTGVEGYEAGKVPARRMVPAPDPHITAVMDERLRRVATYSVIATTQGRVSVAHVIETAIRGILEKEGVPLALGKPKVDVDPYNTAVWAVQVFGPDDLSDNFNPIQNAIDHLAARCLLVVQRALQPDGSFKAPWYLEVFPYNEGISNRYFGWVARIAEEAE